MSQIYFGNIPATVAPDAGGGLGNAWIISVSQARERYGSPSKKLKEKKKIERKKDVIEDIILNHIKNDKFVLRAVESDISGKGYKVNIDTDILLYGILQAKTYQSARIDINRALVSLQNKINKRLEEEEEEDVIRMVALLLH